MTFKKRVRIVSGFYKGFRGKLLSQDELTHKFLVRFRVGPFQRLDVWLDSSLFK
jgi:hypothetical protein